MSDFVSMWIIALLMGAIGFLAGTLTADSKWHDRFEEAFRDYQVYREVDDMFNLDTYCRVGVEEGWIPMLLPAEDS